MGYSASLELKLDLVEAKLLVRRVACKLELLCRAIYHLLEPVRLMNVLSTIRAQEFISCYECDPSSIGFRGRPSA